jgi:energy-coupling factor transporter ATP-binding protein EcfA2
LKDNAAETLRQKRIAADVIQEIDHRLDTLERQREIRNWLIGAITGTAGYSIAWLIAILTVYPRSRAAQSVLIWNSSLRKISSLWFLQAAILIWRPLRDRIMMPFRDRLLADAELDTFDITTFYSDIHLLSKDQKIMSLNDIETVGGSIVIEGRSGTGKSTLLRALAQRALDKRETCVYLKATRCGNGVVNAIAERLDAPASDTDFVRQLIHAGRISIFIDGLNEAPLTVAEAVRSFIDDNRNVRVLVSTQPIRWEAPNRSHVFAIQPLVTDSVEAFLITLCNGSNLSQDARASYQGRTQAFVTELRSILGSVEYDTLTRPIDLTIASSLLQAGEEPSMRSLREQAIGRAMLPGGREISKRQA